MRSPAWASISPPQLLLEQAQEAAGNVEVLRMLVAEPELGAELAQNVLWAMYGEERDRLVRTGKVCIDAGVETRLVEIEEAKAMQKVAEFRALFLAATSDSRAPLTRAAPGAR